MMLKREHFLKEAKKHSVKSKLFLSDRRFDFCTEHNRRVIAKKPLGTWYSWGSSWLDFLNSDSAVSWGKSRANSYDYIYKLDINFDKVARLKSISEFKKFTEWYGVKPHRLKNTEHINDFKNHKYYLYPHLINWEKVAKDYAGIDIRYNDSADEMFFWYKGWDVSGGCVWKRDGLIRWKQVYNHKQEASHFRTTGPWWKIK